MNLVKLTCLALLVSAAVCAQDAAPRLVSPEVMADHSVVFRMRATGAKSVQVTGSWTLEKKPVDMRQVAPGTFEVRIDPLPSDLYEYHFSVDGLQVLDPSNGFVTTGGTVVENRVVVPGGLGDLLATQKVPHGNVTAMWYPSPTLGSTRRMYVYTPPGYNEGNQKYPVLYLLHGAGGDEESWISRGRANYVLDNLIAAGKAVPMIVVITNGNVNVASSALNRVPDEMAKDGGAAAGMATLQFEKSLVRDVMPFVERNFRVVADPAHRALAGFSMGGYQTQNISNSHPGMFKYIAVMSMGLFSSLPNVHGTYDRAQHVAELKALIAAKPTLYWIGVGKRDFVYDSVVKLRSLYDEVGMPYTYRESDGGHTWNEWRLYLTELAPKFFR